MQNPCLNPTADQTYEVIGEGPYNFAKVLARTREMERAGNVEEACNERFQAFQRFAELVPEDEEVNLEWNHRNSRAALELIRASAIDHFLINDFEMSAALLELLLELDPEDHLEGSELLAFDYLAMDEQELFDEVINDVSDKYASREILLLWSAFRRGGKLPEGELQRFKPALRPISPNLRPRSIPPTRLTCAISRANALRFGRRPANCGCRPKTYGVSGPDSSGRCARPDDERQELRRRRG